MHGCDPAVLGDSAAAVSSFSWEGALADAVALAPAFRLSLVS